MATEEAVDTGGAYIGLSATNIKLEDPPEIGDELTLVVKVKCIGDGNKLMADGELRPKRTLKVEWVGPAGSKPPADPQTGMFDKSGNVTKEAAGDEASADEGDEIIAARREAAEADEDSDDEDEDGVDTGDDES